MFGYVTASPKELDKETQKRYSAVYCGICRRIRVQSGNVARLGLSYDMAFLALLLMSLYEPEEISGKRACGLHPIRPRPIAEAIVTKGGIKVNEVDPKTMQSKLADGLYFAGEVLDVDAYTGGFNLQIAFSTARLAAQSAVWG